MGIEFDPVNSYILITSPQTEVSAQDMYNASMDWADDLENMQYSVPMVAQGKFPLGGGVYSDKIFLLAKGWKIKFWSGTYSAEVIGTLITDDESDRTVPPDSGSVEVAFVVATYGSEVAWSPQEKEALNKKLNSIKTLVQISGS